MIHTRDASRLLPEQCRIFVAGGYREAMIVSRKHAAGDLEVAAHAGGDRAKKALQGTDPGAMLALVQRALRDGRPAVAPREAQDPPPGAQNPSRGEGSLLVLPLKGGEMESGALILHAMFPGAFPPAEIALLAQVTTDLGHALTFLHEHERLQRHTVRLRAAEERYAGIFENAREGIFAATRAGRLKLVNPAFARLLGYESPNALLKSGDADLARILSRHDHARLMAALEAGVTGPPLEVDLRRRGGHQVWVSLNAQVVSSFDNTWIEGFVQDLTPLRAEREQSRRLAAVVDATEVAMLMKSPDGVIESWNRGAEKLFGYTAEETIGRLATDLIIPPHLVEEEQSMLDQARSGAPIPDFETQRLRKDGTLVEVAVSASPIFSADGLVMGVSVMEHDVTGRKQEEATRRALEQQRAEVRKLEEIDRVRTEFINEASHELKTPLTPIVSHLELLRDRDDLDGHVLRSVQVIERNANRLEALVNDMLDVSRLEAGRLDLEPRPTQACRLIRDAVESYTHVARRQGIELELDVQEELMAHVDRPRITQVLFNLIDNAVKFSTTGGTVHIRARPENGHILVVVQDDGPGLMPDQIGQLFRPFAMLHDPGQGPPGTGLGLFISKSIIDQHGGRIWAESRGPGTGLSVCFTLEEAGPGEPAPAAAAHEPT